MFTCCVNKKVLIAVKQTKRRPSVPSLPTSATETQKLTTHARPDPRRNILQTFSYRHSAPPKPDDIPPDNIFVPIQADDILPQIPIGDHHPVPRTGIEDEKDRTLHTNSFYANAFLGAQNQPVWTHPYSLWWGQGTGTLQTWGMNVGHVEEVDLLFEGGEPPKVS